MQLFHVMQSYQFIKLNQKKVGNKPVKTVKCNELSFDNKNLDLKKSASKRSILRKHHHIINQNQKMKLDWTLNLSSLTRTFKNPVPPALNREEERRNETKTKADSNINKTTYSSEPETSNNPSPRPKRNRKLKIMFNYDGLCKLSYSQLPNKQYSQTYIVMMHYRYGVQRRRTPQTLNFI